MKHYCESTGYEIDTTPLDEVGDKYLRDCARTAKENPSIETGMLCMVFDDEMAFIGFGQIIHTEWSDYHSDHIADLQMVGGSLEQSVPACNLRRVKYDGSTMYAILKQRTIKGGRA